MLERLQFILEGCVGEGAQDSDHAHCSVGLKRRVAETGRRSRDCPLCFV